MGPCERTLLVGEEPEQADLPAPLDPSTAVC